MNHPNQKLSLPPDHFFKGQFTQIATIGLLIVGLSYLLDWDQLSQTSFAGISGTYWAILTIIIPPIHQLYVWYVWRSELMYQKISPLFNGRGFQFYTLGFVLFLLSRPILLIIVGVLDYGSIQLHWTIVWILTPIMAVLVVYTLYSVDRYFGLPRAVGGDHFYEEYRDGFVQKGIFQYISNAMYTTGFLLVFVIGVWTFSKAVLLLGAYHYLAIWIHYFCTEKPDIVVIYTSR